jgi:1-acyl-sn-glycerol-3-phosphate acyltransferase
MALARSLIFAVLFYLGTLFYVLAIAAAMPFGQEAVRRWVRSWAEFHYWLLRHVLLIRFDWRGRIPEGPYLIAVKHQSMIEAVDTLRFARTPVVVMKRELSRLPLFGWVALRYGIIPVDRDAGAKALREMMALGKAAAANGRPVIIFPEGTRVAPGEAPPLRPGFAGLYRALGLPVVPIAHDSGKLWPRGKPKSSGTIHFKVGETIPPGLKRAEVEARVHAALNALN